jgi:hypothetical protein
MQRRALIAKGNNLPLKKERKKERGAIIPIRMLNWRNDYTSSDFVE